MNLEMKMPRTGANDDFVTLAQWMVKNGDHIKKNQVLAILETTKETSELEASADGFVELTVTEGEDIEVGKTIAVIHESLEDFPFFKNSEVKQVEDRKYSDKAMRLIQQYRIDVNLLPTDRIIREKDVKKWIVKPYSIAETDSCKVLIYCGGGFCKMIIDILRQRGEYQIAGILDRKYPQMDKVKEIPVIGKSDSEQLQLLYQKGYRKIINALGFDGKQHGRKAPYEMLKQIGYECVNVIHNQAILEPSIMVGEGNLIAAGAIIGSDVRIGNNCIINAGAIISHDCIISDHCHIASGAVLGGEVVVGENTLVGQGCTIFRNIRIGANVVIKNGVNITRNIPDNTYVEK